MGPLDTYDENEDSLWKWTMEFFFTRLLFQKRHSLNCSAHKGGSRMDLEISWCMFLSWIGDVLLLLFSPCQFMDLHGMLESVNWKTHLFFSGNIAKSCPEKIVLGVFATFRFQTFDCYMRFRVVKWCIKDMYAIWGYDCFLSSNRDESFGPTTFQSKEDEAVNRGVTRIGSDGCKKRRFVEKCQVYNMFVEVWRFSPLNPSSKCTLKIFENEPWMFHDFSLQDYKLLFQKRHSVKFLRSQGGRPRMDFEVSFFDALDVLLQFFRCLLIPWAFIACCNLQSG